jgi:hypothetical protein
MKNLALLLFISVTIFAFSCSKDEKSERFKFLTEPIWVTDSLLANGVDASGPGGPLENFKGEAKFNEDGTGTFGVYTGGWQLSVDETAITISSQDLPYAIKAITCDIVELTAISFKIKFVAPVENIPVNFRLTFKPK